MKFARLSVVGMSSVMGLSVTGLFGADDAWSKIEPYFTPPAEFAKPLESLRSPLLFNDGSSVKTKEDWARRRAEIVKTWTSLIGEWPPLIEHPIMEKLESTKRETFMQHKVRLEVTKGVMLSGYLLVPEGKGPFPAVVVPYYDPETSVASRTSRCVTSLISSLVAALSALPLARLGAMRASRISRA